MNVFWNDFQQNQAVLFFLFCQMVSFLICILLKIICPVYLLIWKRLLGPVLTTGLVMGYIHDMHLFARLNDAMSFPFRIEYSLE